MTIDEVAAACGVSRRPVIRYGWPTGPHNKSSPETIALIRRMKREGAMIKDIAKAAGVSRTTVGYHTSDIASLGRTAEPIIAEIRRMRMARYSLEETARQLGVSEQTVTKYAGHYGVNVLHVTGEQKAEMRRRRLAGEDVVDIALSFGVSAVTVYKHTVGLSKRKRRSRVDVSRVKQLLARKLPGEVIAERLGCTPSYVSLVKRGYHDRPRTSGGVAAVALD